MTDQLSLHSPPTGDGLLCLSDVEPGSVGPACGGPSLRGPMPWAVPGALHLPYCHRAVSVIHPAPEFSAFQGVTFALLWSENQTSRWVGATGEVSEKPRGGVWRQQVPKWTIKSWVT